MQILENISLKSYNTFGIDVIAGSFGKFSDSGQLAELLDEAGKLPHLILGGGSNILFTKNFRGMVLLNNIMGLELIKEDERHLYVRVGAGENWHRFVMYCIERHWAGIENLALIPGNVGASPMQNIGAYGVEVKEVIEELEAFHVRDKIVQRFTANDCQFGYRDSIFKGRFRNQFVILNVVFRLNKVPNFRTHYGDIERELEKMGTLGVSLQALAGAVMRIRKSKLPEPSNLGNAGSFFKNPLVDATTLAKLKKSCPSLVSYANPAGAYKIAAGWLIEQCGWKGYRKGDVGCYDKQALILVNYGGASGKEILALSEDIVKSVYKRFGIQLVPEVNIV